MRLGGGGGGLLLLDEVLLEETLHRSEIRKLGYASGNARANHEGLLLLAGLETSVSELGGGVDELEVDLLEGLAVGAGVHALAESQHTLVDSDGASLEDQEVVLDKTVVSESTEGVDGLVGKIVGSGGVVCDELSVDLVLK